MKEAEVLAHTIKSSAGNIGALEVQAAAAGIEEALREKSLESAESMVKSFIAAMEQVLESLASLKEMEAAEGIHTKTISIEELGSLLYELAEYLRNNDFQATKLTDGLVDQLEGTEYADTLGTVIEQVGNYEFQPALERLMEISIHLGIDLG